MTNTDATPFDAMIADAIDLASFCMMIDPTPIDANCSDDRTENAANQLAADHAIDADAANDLIIALINAAASLNAN